MPTVERRLPGRVKPECEVVMKPSQAGTEVHVTGESNANVTTKRTQHGVEKVWEHMASKGKSNCDLEIRCEDGIIFSHQAVLGLASKMVRDLICRQSQLEVSLGGWPGGAVVPVICDRRKEEHVVIVVPDISRGVMSKLLNLLYSGNIPIQDTEEAAKVKEAWKVLEIDVVNLKKLIFEKVDVPAIKKEAVSPEGFRIKKDPSEIAPFRMSRHAHGGDDEDPDDPDPLGDFSDQASRRNSVGASGTKRRPGPASRTVIDKAPLKKMKIENGNQKYKVEQIHNCVICNGKTADGKVDKDAINLSFRQLKKLKEHYAKCMYGEGKITKFVDPESGNKDENGDLKDEYGASYRYRCSVKGCWKAKKKVDVGYKEMALHNVAEHGVLELMLEEENRPELKSVLEQIEIAKQRELEETKPLTCKIRGCLESEVPFKNTDNYRALKGHYALQHFRGWFREKSVKGEPRTQRATEPRRGTDCKLCNAKVFGDDEAMVEHYSVVHDRLEMAILASDYSADVTQMIMKDLFPERVEKFNRKQ